MRLGDMSDSPCAFVMLIIDKRLCIIAIFFHASSHINVYICT